MVQTTADEESQFFKLERQMLKFILGTCMLPVDETWYCRSPPFQVYALTPQWLHKAQSYYFK